MNTITYNFEYDKKIKVCFIGAGGHSYRNIFPAFQYAPVDLLAVCDIQPERARQYAKLFGGERYYSDYREMLSKERPDAVFIVTSYHPDGRVQATDLALEVLRSGAHVWMEKPTASSVDEVKQLIEAGRRYDRFVMTGLKKTFFPAIEKVKQIITSPEFGRPSSIYVRYPQSIPALAERSDLTKVCGLLDHIYHPGSVLHYLMGKIAQFSYVWEPMNGGSVASLRFQSGSIGTLHLAAGISGSSPLEYLEVIGDGANIIVENGVKVTYYRKADRPQYGRAASFLVADQQAPLYWEPEFSLGQLCNKNLFFLGYVPEILHFCDSVLAGTAPVKGTLEEALEISKLFEAYCRTPEGAVTAINS